MNGFTASEKQDQKLAELNDKYGVASWEVVSGVMYVWLDDGDECEVSRDGLVTWKSVSG